MFRLRDDVIASTAGILIVAYIITGIALGALYYFWMDGGDGDPSDGGYGDNGEVTTIAWMVSVEGDNYIVEIIQFDPMDLDDVGFTVLNINFLVANWDDPDGESIRIEGGLDDINFVQSDYDTADTRPYNTFYSREPVGDPPKSTNVTLCIVFMDVDGDHRIGSGDVIWIRSMDNGGAADEDYRFRLIDESRGEAIGDITLPPT